MKLYCCGCQETVEATLVNGATIYPHRKDLHTLPFWQCPACCNYVGCHHKTDEPTKPLGCIPTKAIKQARMRIHELADPLWKDGFIKRAALYREISKLIGYTYHAAEIRTIDEARKIEEVVGTLRKKSKWRNLNDRIGHKNPR